MDAGACDIVELAAVRVRGRVDRRPVPAPRPPVAADQPAGVGRARLPRGRRVRSAAVRGGLARVPRRSWATTCWWRTTATRSTSPCFAALASGLPGVEELVFFDTLPLARSLMDESARLEDLAHRFGVSRGRSHHAIDDAATLVGVARHLGELRLVRARKTALVQLLGWLGLALALDAPAEPTAGGAAAPRRRPAGGPRAATAAASRPTPSRRPAPTRPPPRSWSSGSAASGCWSGCGPTAPVAERYPASAARLAGAGRLERRADAGREHRPAAQPRRAVAERRKPAPTTGV